MSDAQGVSVTILEREYKIACAPNEREALIQAAALVDRKMRDIRDQGKLLPMDRIAVLAALNIAHEGMGARQQLSGLSDELGSELRRLNARLDGALERF